MLVSPTPNKANFFTRFQVKFDDYNPHQQPPLYQPHHIQNLVSIL
jgi:hypothetical protein